MIVKPIMQPYYYSNNDSTSEATTNTSSYFNSLEATRTPSPSQDNSTNTLHQQPTETTSSSSFLHPNSSKPYW